MPKFLHTLGSLLPAALDFGPGKRKKKICLFGADTSGKTTFLYRLKLGYAVTTIPTIGFNVETVPWTVGAGGRRDGKGEGKQQEWEFDFYDVGGEFCFNCLWVVVVARVVLGFCCMMNRLVVSLVVDGPRCFHGEQYACQSTWLMHATLLCLVLEDASW